MNHRVVCALSLVLLFIVVALLLPNISIHHIRTLTPVPALQNGNTPFTPTHGCCGSERIEYGRNFAYRVRRQYGILFTLAEIGGYSTERVHSQYGLTIRSTRSIRETCNHFQNWAADRGGSGRKSADTVRIQYAYSTDAADRDG